MSLQDIKGQDKPVQIIKNYLRCGSFQGVYLFSGPEGIGKKLTAQTLAKALNCLNKEDDSCDTCRPCLKIESGQHPDVHLIDAGDSDALKIEYIRDLKKEANLRAYEAKKKVFIINDAHNLTAEAQNALLKITEEPPRDTVIILVTSKPSLLFKTILSRCKVIRFFPLERQRLEEILKQDYALSITLAHYFAYLSEGRLGTALRFKETPDFLREKNKIIDEFVSLKNPRSDNFSKADLRKQLNILVTWFRDLYLLKTGSPHAELINLDRKEELLKTMGRYSLFDLDDMMGSIAQSFVYLDQNINVNLLVSNLRAELWRK